MRYAEAPCKGGAVAVVTVEQLNHAGHVGEPVNARAVDWIDEPRATVLDERVRAPLQSMPCS